MARNLMKMRKYFPNDYDFFPKTWVLPQDGGELRGDNTNQFGKIINKKKTYIVKPDNLAQGKGIYLSRNVDRIVENCTNAQGGWVV